MKNSLLLAFAAVLLFLVGPAIGTLIPEYANMCVGCVLNVNNETNSTNYFCSKQGQCSTVYVENNSCEQGVATCINYGSADLGIKEIPPFSPNTKASFNYTIRSGSGARFAISNQDSITKAWFKLMLKIAPSVDSVGSLGEQEFATDSTDFAYIKDLILD
jgi:hypothetical protein